MIIHEFCARRRPRARGAVIAAAGVALFALSGGGAAEPADAAAAGQRTWQYQATTVTLSGDTLRVGGIGEMANYVLGSPWHAVPAAVAIIDYGVTHIGEKAFMGMNGLKSVSIPNSVVSIGPEAFRETGLTSITIPRGVKSINLGSSEGAFNGCADLASITVAADNAVYSSEDGVLFSKGKTALILYPRGKKGAYTIPGSVKTIGHRAFAVHYGITSITIPGSVESIEDEAFAACGNLTSVTIEDGVKSIKYLAFWGCGGLKYVTIPRSVTSISNEAFAGCTGLVSITVADDNPNYSSEGGALFNKSKTVLIHCPQGRLSASYTVPSVARYKMFALSILTALILFAAIFAIIKKTPKASGRKRAVFIAAAAALSAAALFAVYTDATTYSLKVKVNPKKGGTASPGGTKRYKIGETAAVTAEAADGYVFAGWSGASALTINPLAIAMDGDKVLTANFKLFEPRTVQIGNRRWMAENLNIITGDSWCYGNDESNCQKYGRLYDYETAMKACPAGWRLPAMDDWNSLIRAGGYNAGAKLKSKTGWDDWECPDGGYAVRADCTPGNVYSGNGTDEFGFNALPGGEGSENDFYGVGKFAQWWMDGDYEWYQLEYYSYELTDVRCIGCGGGSSGSSIRCVQDVPGVPEKSAVSGGPPPPVIRSWKSGETDVTLYADGMVRVSGNGEMEDCYPPWREYHRYASMADCNSPWRGYSVTGLIVEDGVTHIGGHAFDGCHIMSSVVISNSVASIERKAFGYCLGLKSIIIRNPNPPKIIGSLERKASEASAAFAESVIENACLYVPANSVDAYRAATGWKDFGCVKELESAPEGI